MNFWKGAFAPMQKHVVSVRLVLLSHMTQEDWDVLDFDELRPSAKEALAEAILDGVVAGFWRVDVDMHKASRPHGGKSRYFYPAPKSAVASGQTPDPQEFQTYQNFDGNVDQDLLDTPAADRLAYLLFMLKALSPDEQVKMMDMINKELPEYEDVDIENLKARDAALALAIQLFLMNRPAAAKRILRAVDIQDDELYAMVNDEEPTD